MTAASAAASSFANSRPHKVNPYSGQTESTNSAIIRIINAIFPNQTVPSLASLLKLGLSTAKNRLLGQRYFDTEELEDLLHTAHGFTALTEIMKRAPNPPEWWLLCEPLMDLADMERMRTAVQRRVNKAIQRHDDADAFLEQQIGRAQAMAVRGSGPARVHADALRTMPRPQRRVVAKEGR